MTSASASAAPRTPGARRRPRVTGDDREAAILATAERLLTERNIAEISVDDLARGAGISRPTFYFYFGSKDAVVVALLSGVIRDAERQLDGIFDDARGARSAGWRDVIAAFFQAFGAHPSIVGAAAQELPTSAEIATMWSAALQDWISRVADGILAERARGAAPMTVSARDLATALVLLNERFLRSIFAGESAAPNSDAAIDVLAHIWTASIYGLATPQAEG